MRAPTRCCRTSTPTTTRIALLVALLAVLLAVLASAAHGADKALLGVAALGIGAVLAGGVWRA